MPVDRRDFAKQLGAGAAGLILAGYAGTARGFAANETLNVGCIGVGGRCQQLMHALKKVAGVKVVALCDVWDRNLNQAKALAEPDAFATKDFRALLDRTDVDAVIVGTPDHWHTPIAVAACAAGKDVYLEKPVTHDLSEGPALIEAQNRHARIVQAGTHQRSMPQFQQAYEIVRSGELGEIHKVRMTWNRNTPRWNRGPLGVNPIEVDWTRFLGNAPAQPFDEYRFCNWRWFWDFGGGIFTDLMVHHLDIAHWYLGLEKPTQVAAIGDNFVTADLWQTPDTVQGLLQYGDKQVQVQFEGTFINARNGEMIEFMGRNGTLYLDRGRYEVIPERHSSVKPSELVLGSGSRGADSYDQPEGEVLHLANWVECIRTRERPHAPAEVGVSAAAAAHMANQAMREARVVKS